MSKNIKDDSDENINCNNDNTCFNQTTDVKTN